MERGDWEENKLENIANTYKERFDPQENESRLYLGLKHIGKGTLRIEDVGDSKETKSSKKVFHSGDILFGRLRPYFRKIVQPNFDGVCSGEFIVIKGKDSVNQKFLFYRLADENLVDRITKTCGGVERPRAKWSVIKDLKIKIPSLPTQKKIASILSNYDDLIENNSRRIELLEEIAKMIYREWFVNFRFPGYEDVEMDYNEELDKEIPKGWEVKELDDILKSIESGNRPKGGVSDINEGVPSIGAENILGLGKYNYSIEKYVPVKFYNNMSRGVVKNRDVLLYKDGAKLGRKSMFMNDFPHPKCCVNSHVYILRTKKNIPQTYLYFWLDLDFMTEKIRNTNTNAAQPGINQGDVKSLPILLPTNKVIDEFNDIIEPVIYLLFNSAKKNQLLRQTRDMLLPRLVTGHIDVSGLDIDILNGVMEAET